MKYRIKKTAFGLTLIFTNMAFAGSDCLENAISTMAIANCYHQEQQKLDNKLTYIYRTHSTPDNTTASGQTETDLPMRAWQTHRKALLNMLHPSTAGSGSARTICVAQTSLAVTRMQLELLSSLLKNAPEGELCNTNTVAINKIETPEAAIITDLNLGDSGCYITYLSANDKQLTEIANYELCNIDNAKGKPALLTHSQQEIAAPECEGNSACRKTVSVRVINNIWLSALPGTPNSR